MLCGAFLALLAVDATATIRNLVLVALHVESVTQLTKKHPAGIPAGGFL